MKSFRFSHEQAKKLYYPGFWVRFALLGGLMILSYLPLPLKLSGLYVISCFFVIFLLAFLYNLIWIFQKMRMYSDFYITVQDHIISYYGEQGHRFMSKCVYQIGHITKVIDAKAYIDIFADIDIYLTESNDKQPGKIDHIRIPKVFENFDEFQSIVARQMQ